MSYHNRVRKPTLPTLFPGLACFNEEQECLLVVAEVPNSHLVKPVAFEADNPQGWLSSTC